MTATILGAARGRPGTVVAAAVVVLALALPLAGAFEQPGAPMEEGKLLTAGELVLEGKVPHSDFEHFYGPADVWAVAGAFVVGGRSVASERALGLVYTAVLVGSVFALARRAGRVPAAGAAIAAGWILAPFGVHAYSWTAGLGLLLLAVVLALRATETDSAGAAMRAASAAGGFGGLALLYRPELIVGVALVLAVVWRALSPGQRKAGLIAAVVTAVVPYLVHLATAGFGDVWRGIITYTLFRLRDGRALPVPPPAHDLTAWLDLSAPEPTPSPLLPDHARVLQLRAFFWVTVLAVAGLVVVAALVWWRRRRTHPAEVRWLLAIAAVAVAATPQMLQRADATHVRFVACVVLALAPLAVVVAVTLFDTRLPRSAAATEALALAMAAVVLAVPYYAARLSGVTVGRAIGSVSTATVGIDGRTFPVIDPLAADATALLATIDELDPAGSTLFVGPQDLTLANYSDSFLYFLLGERYRPVSFFLESNPGISNAPDSPLAGDIARADVLVLSKEYDNWDEPNASRRRGPVGPRQIGDRDFCIVRELGRYQLLVHTGSPLCT